MRQFVLSLAIFIVYFLLPCAARAGTLSPLIQFTAGTGEVRTYRVFVPSGYAQSTDPIPVVFAMHGGAGSATQSSACTPDGLRCHPQARWMDLADRDHFLVVYPDARIAASGARTWNDCRSDFNNGSESFKDVEFLNEMIDRIKRDFPRADLDRVYFTGSSNSAMLSFRLAQELSHRIAAIGTNIGNLPVDPDQQCQPPLNPISVFQHNGTQDPLMPYLGGIAGNGGLVISSEATRDHWRRFNGTGPLVGPFAVGDQMYNADGGFYDDLSNPATFRSPDFDGTPVNSTVSYTASNSGNEGTAVFLYTTLNGGHKMPTTLPRFMVSPRQTDSISGAENHDFNNIDETWSRIRDHTLGQLRWQRTNFGGSAGRSFVVDETGGFVSTARGKALWRIFGTGHGLDGTSDSVHFLSHTVGRTSTLQLRLSAMVGAEPNSEFSMVLRETLRDNSPFRALSIKNGRLLQKVRSKAWQSVKTTDLGPVKLPLSLRIVRDGRLLRLLTSLNGVDFSARAILYPTGNFPVESEMHLGFGYSGPGNADVTDVALLLE